MTLSSKKSFLPLAIFMCSISTSYGSLQNFSTKQGPIKLDIPAQWQSLENFLGTPVTLLSPQGVGGNRTVIQITPYAVTDKEGVLKKIPKDPEEYIKQKEDWLESVDGESLAYDSFHEEKLNDATIYSIGMSYEIPSGQYHQQSFYISDQSKRIYFVTALMPIDQEKQSLGMVKTITRSIASLR